MARSPIRETVGVRRSLVPVILVVLFTAGGCGLRSESTPAGPTGTVTGDVLAGPTCPVETSDGTGCEPVAVEGRVEFWQGDQRKGEVTIRVDGTFSADMPPGDYTAKVVPATTPFPTCTDAPVTVAASATTVLHLQCDTGIR